MSIALEREAKEGNMEALHHEGLHLKRTDPAVGQWEQEIRAKPINWQNECLDLMMGKIKLTFI